MAPLHVAYEAVPLPHPLLATCRTAMSYACQFGRVKGALCDGEQSAMYALLSVLSGLVLCVLVYGLSFVPSATLAQTDEAREEMNRTHQRGVKRDPEDAEATLDAQSGTDHDSDAS
jgi:hypothetical protein